METFMLKLCMVPFQINWKKNIYIYIYTNVSQSDEQRKLFMHPPHDSWLEPVSKTQSCHIEGRLLAVITISLSLGWAGVVYSWEAFTWTPLARVEVSGFILVHNIRFTVFLRGGKKTSESTAEGICEGRSVHPHPSTHFLGGGGGHWRLNGAGESRN